MATTTVVCVPGPWAGTSDLRVALGDDPPVVVELVEHDDRMVDAFRHAGAYSDFTEDEFAQLATHRSVCYLVDEDAGTPEAAGRLARLASALVWSGGYGVKVESAGRAHSPGDWLDRFDGDFDDGDLIEGFVFWYLDPAVGYLSCGMHNLGHPDVVVPQELGSVEGLALVRSFLYFQLVDGPELHDGETFSTAEGEPIYRLRHVPPPEDEAEWDDLFTNEHGVWHLEPA